MRYAVILAGGSGQRLWPASRQTRPKQFLPLGASAGESLLAATRRRLGQLCPADNVMVVTAMAHVDQVRTALPDLAAANILAEPIGRNTAAALGLAAVHLHHRDPEAVMGALPADHHIADERNFNEVVERAFALAARTPVIVTIGVVPTRAETGFGYLHVGEAFDEHADVVLGFREKPDAETAQAYFASDEYVWNGGMFFLQASRLLRDIETYMPETAAGLAEIRRALEAGGDSAARAAAAQVYPDLPKVSIDYGVMERTSDVVTIRGDFGWNDVGSWAALADYREPDSQGNISDGNVVIHDARNNIVVGDTEHAIAVIGADNLVVVQSGNGILVVPRHRAQEVREAVRVLQEHGLDDYL